MAEPAHELFLRVLGTLNEAQARWFVAEEAIALGRGGLQAMAELTGMSRTTILRGMRELREGTALERIERVRAPGGGRKRLEASDPKLDRALEKILDETTAGDPMSPLRWTSKSTDRIAKELTRQRHPVSGETVRRRLKELGYSLQQNVKSKEGSSPEGRDEQFRYINRLVKRHLRSGQPVLSVDTTKKEPAIPYGAYGVARNEGFASVGVTKDTAEFAVEAIRRWWRSFGRRHYPKATALLVCPDGGGSDGARNRAWKFHLQRLADKLSLEITVCHYPPGTSKWNKIEHRMFSYISLNWRGRPLVGYETVVNLISSTTTRTGLRVKAALDEREYEAGVKIPDEEMSRLNLKRHRTHPNWNYTLAPRSS